MALFSRRGNQTPDSAEPDSSASDVSGSRPEESAVVSTDADLGVDAPAAAVGAGAGAGAGAASDGVEDGVAEPIPHVGISVSTFGQPRHEASTPVEGAAPTERATYVRPPAEAPAPSQSMPGLPDNVLVRAALSGLSEKPEPREVMNVARQLLQGHLFVRVRGDARTLLAEGKDMTLAVSAVGDNRFLLAFTGGDALQASVRSDGDTQTSAMGQPAANVIRNVLAGPYAGLILDHATADARVILPVQLLQKAMDEADPEFTIKNLLANVRTPETAAAVVDALREGRAWIAANVAPGSTSVGVAESRTPEGARYLEVYSHPLEVATLGRGDRAVAVTAEQLGKALAADEGIRGVIVDPAGPWIELSRADLAPLLALAG